MPALTATAAVAIDKRSLAIKVAFRIAVLAATLYGLLQRLPGWNPASLWLDDEWVGIVVRRMSLPDFFHLRPPVPIGFVVVERALSSIFLDPEWSLQIFPFVCGVALIPLLSLLALQLGASKSVAIFAAVCAATSPMSSELSVRVKQYSSDTLTVTLLLLAGLPLLAKYSRRGALDYCLASLLAALFSFPSVFISVSIVHVAAATHWARSRSWRALLPVLAFDLALLALWQVMLRGQSSQAMREYWSGHYMPLEPSAALGFLRNSGYYALKTAFPQGLAAMLWLLPLGIYDLAQRPRTRGLALVIVLLAAALICASGLRMYPLGGGRTDSFMHPVVILCVACGVNRLKTWLAQLTDHAQPLAELVPLALAWLLLWPGLKVGIHAVYPPSGDAKVIQAVERSMQPSDGLIISPHGTISVGHYGSWPLRFVPWDAYAHNFHVHIERPNTLGLSPYTDYWQHPELLEPELSTFLKTDYPRVFFIAAGWAHASDRDFTIKRIVERGYTLVQQVRSGDARALLFTR
ncbi:MAG TPA: hypothetical protein VJR89_41885 [Polyangiales bacterium]|nr:hypothetical protein [Polyangiales bacterium]